MSTFQSTSRHHQDTFQTPVRHHEDTQKNWLSGYIEYWFQTRTGGREVATAYLESCHCLAGWRCYCLSGRLPLLICSSCIIMPLRGPTCKIARFQAKLKFPSCTECGNNFHLIHGLCWIIVFKVSGNKCRFSNSMTFKFGIAIKFWNENQQEKPNKVAKGSNSWLYHQNLSKEN